MPDQTEMANVVWKEELNPSDDLTKLSQYVRAYSAATMDKASEVSSLLKEKYQMTGSLQSQVSEAVENRTIGTMTINTAADKQPIK